MLRPGEPRAPIQIESLRQRAPGAFDRKALVAGPRRERAVSVEDEQRTLDDAFMLGDDLFEPRSHAVQIAGVEQRGDALRNAGKIHLAQAFDLSIRLLARHGERDLRRSHGDREHDQSCGERRPERRRNQGIETANRKHARPIQRETETASKRFSPR